MNLLEKLYREEDGQGLTEYVLILSLVVIVLISFLNNFGEALETSYNNSKDALP